MNSLMNIFAFILLILVMFDFSFGNITEQCKKAQFLWKSIEYPYSNIPKDAMNVLQCPASVKNQCCDSSTLKSMAFYSDVKLKELSQQKLENLLILFSNDSYNLQKIFMDNLDETKMGLNKMFIKTYGYNYKLHRTFFYGWFDKLKQYMRGEIQNITKLLDNFFMEMAQRIVNILISANSSPRLSECHTKKLIQSNPYQHTDVTVKENIIKSYPPARLMANAIAVGRDVMRDMMDNTKISSQCLSKYNSGFNCMICGGILLKPCPVTCNNIVKNCFGSYPPEEMKKFEKIFNKYIMTLVKLGEQLDNPFNFPLVNNKLSVQISTAIMNVQQRYPNVKENIIRQCSGISKRKRKKRQANEQLLKWMDSNKNDNPQFEQKLIQNFNNDRQRSRDDIVSDQNKRSDALTPWARQMKQNYLSLKNYFDNIPRQYCFKNSETQDKCWNGTIVVSKNNILYNDAPDKKPKTKSKMKITNPTIKEAIKRIQKITKTILNHLKGKNKDPVTEPVAKTYLYQPRHLRNTETNPKQTNPTKNPSTDDLESSGDNFNDPLGTPPKQVPPKIPQLPVVDQPKKPQPNQPSLLQPPKQNIPQIFTDLEASSGSNPDSTNNNNNNKKNNNNFPIIITSPPSKQQPGNRKSTTTPSIKKPDLDKKPTNPIPDDEDMNPPTDNNPAGNNNKNPNVIDGSGTEPKQPLPFPPLIPVITKKPQIQPNPLIPPSSSPKPLPFPPISIPPRPRQGGPLVDPDIEGTGDKTASNFNTPVPPFPIDETPNKPFGNNNNNFQPKGSNNNNFNNNNFNGVPSTKPRTRTDDNSNQVGGGGGGGPITPKFYPGKVPPEVWIPEIEGVQKSGQGQQQLTTRKLSSHLTTSSTLLMTTISCSIYIVLYNNFL